MTHSSRKETIGGQPVAEKNRTLAEDRINRNLELAHWQQYD